jgi:hypothetical protein
MSFISMDRISTSEAVETKCKKIHSRTCLRPMSRGSPKNTQQAANGLAAISIKSRFVGDTASLVVRPARILRRYDRLSAQR